MNTTGQSFLGLVTLALAACSAAAMTSPTPSPTPAITVPAPAPPPVTQTPDTSPPQAATTAVFTGFDQATQGAWKGKYGSLGVHMYPDGGTSDFPRSFIRGAGTQFRWPLLSFDPQLPQRYSGRNCCDPIRWSGGIVQTGDPWPPDARFGAGLYNRTADGVPFRIAIGRAHV